MKTLTLKEIKSVVFTWYFACGLLFIVALIVGGAFAIKKITDDANAAASRAATTSPATTSPTPTTNPNTT